MSVMDKLEIEIASIAKERIKSIRKEVDCIKSESKFIEIPLMVDGVLDKLVYNVKTNQFEEIRYKVWDGGEIACKTIKLKEDENKVAKESQKKV